MPTSIWAQKHKLGQFWADAFRNQCLQLKSDRNNTNVLCVWSFMKINYFWKFLKTFYEAKFFFPFNKMPSRIRWGLFQGDSRSDTHKYKNKTGVANWAQGRARSEQAWVRPWVLCPARRPTRKTYHLLLACYISVKAHNFVTASGDQLWISLPV